MIWRAERIGRNGRVIWQGEGVAMLNRFEFLQWIRAVCRAAGFADRARRQTDIPAIWDSAVAGSGFVVRNYSPLGGVAAVRFSCVAAELEYAEYVI